jgi:NAD(P)-dependent dehydrogenase (short-subunit alcohol dehydrogenase family)
MIQARVTHSRSSGMVEEQLRRYREAAERTAQEQRRIQDEMDRRDRERKQEQGGGEQKQEAVQAGSRAQPTNPLPAQHLEKPGIEAELEVPPRYDAPGYRGSDKLRDMVALVTGGDSGIGWAVAVLFAREGADVAIVYLSEHEDAETTRQAVEREGRRCITISGDVRDSDFCRAAVEHTVRELGKLDVLVNNAAFQEHVQSLEELSDEHLDMTMRTNIYGYIHMARAALPHLGSGSSIINTGSETGLFGQPMLLDYSATKGAIHAFTRALATNVVSKGIRVNAVAPGPVWTPLNPADQPAEKVKQFGHATDMKRPAQPEELAPAYVFLASPVCSSYITGVVLPVMGGVTGAA